MVCGYSGSDLYLVPSAVNLVLQTSSVCAKTYSINNNYNLTKSNCTRYADSVCATPFTTLSRANFKSRFNPTTHLF
jgi:hypothetical protein